MSSADELLFADEQAVQGPDTEPVWKLLVVDDDEDVHLSTRFALRRARVLGRRLQLIEARSASEAYDRLREDPEIAVALLDVVMEHERAGIDLVAQVRQQLGRNKLRIILRTGQPGYAPEADTVERYDINDYRNKTELTQARLLSVLTVAIRTFQHLQSLEARELALSQALAANEALLSRLESLAYRDTLVGLFNREGLLEAMRQAPPTEARRLLLIDIDDFGTFNDLLGHAYGDALLKSVADRLRNWGTHNSGTLLARVAADVFAIAGPLTTVRTKSVRAALEAPHRLPAGDHRPGLSLALTEWSADQDPIDVLKDAFIALKRARQSGLSQTAEFSVDFAQRARAQVQRLDALRRALADGLLCAYFQPIVCVPGAELTGFEALVRWRQSDGSFVSPAEFIPVAEQSGLIHEIGLLMLEQSLQFQAAMRESGHEDLHLSVNLSIVQLRSSDWWQQLDALLAKYPAPPGLLQFEVTESVSALNHDWLKDQLSELSKRGIGVAIDDFGTGYSSLAYLSSFRVQRLKIDRSFIQALGSDSIEAQIARLVVELAQGLGVKAVAEGVETQSQADLLAELGCHEAQGYWFGRPQPADFFLSQAKEGPLPTQS